VSIHHFKFGASREEDKIDLLQRWRGSLPGNIAFEFLVDKSLGIFYLCVLCGEGFRKIKEEDMFFHQKIFAILASFLIMAVVVELVRRRKLKEEYSWLWLLTGGMIILLVVWYDLLVALTALIGAIAPTTTLFIFGLIFLMLISLHYSIQISRLSRQVKNMAQELAILRGRVEEDS
jgi:hypothetical protein